MPDERETAPFESPVAVRGLLRGADLLGEGRVTLGEDALSLYIAGNRMHPRDVTLPLPLADLDGVRWEDGQLTLFLRSNDVLELVGGQPLAALTAAMLRQCRALPEVTRPLRALGSRRGHLGADHERFYGVFLAARKAAARAADVGGQMAAFDAAALRDAMERVCHDFASTRYPRSAPERRALDAQLADAAEALRGALARLAASAAAVREADDDVTLVRWRAWARSVQEVFDQADRCWMSLLPLLEEEPVRARPHRWTRWFRLGAVAAMAALADSAGAQRATWRVEGAALDTIRARGFDVVWANASSALVVADEAELARLRGQGWSVSGVAVSASPFGRAAAAAPVVYRSFDDPVRGVRAHLDSLARSNPRVRVDSIGASYEGRPILAVKVGEAGASTSRPDVLVLATYHAREWAATEMALRLIRYLASATPDARVDSLVRDRDIWIVPVVNPDGYQFTFTTDRLWRKNRRPVATDPGGTPIVGVDLNRNHNAHWGLDDIGSSPNPRSEVYRGPAPASEPETQVIERFHALHPPVVSISYHTFTGLILYPPGHTYGLLPQDAEIYRALAGTDVRPAVIDRLPGSNRGHYHPGPSWTLYTTNGEYNDWAYSRFGTISFTPELTSGFEGQAYYGFVFPDDEAKLQIMFGDNLPFALDAIEIARDPLAARPQATGLRPDRIVLESLVPGIRALVPATSVANTRVEAPPPVVVPFTVDDDDGGHYAKRITTPQRTDRPGEVRLSVETLAASYGVLAATGAEAADARWSASGFAPEAGGVAGANSWRGSDGAWLRSPPIQVPAASDTISVLFWTRYSGDGFSLVPRGIVRMTTAGTENWSTVGIVSGAAPAFYPERVVIGGVANRTIELEFRPQVLTWWLDEITVLAHGGRQIASSGAGGLRVSENPVRGVRVRFAWPFETAPGELVVYDFAGRQVWRTAVSGGIVEPWELGAAGVRNGVYLAVARSGDRSAQRKLFVARPQ